VWAVGRLGVAAAWPASRRRSTGRRDGLVLSGVAVWIDRRSALGGRTAPPDTHRHRPDTERTCLAVEPTKFTPAHQTRQNSPVCVVSGVAMWTGQSLQIFCRRQSWVVGNPIHADRQDRFVVSGVRISFKGLTGNDIAIVGQNQRCSQGHKCRGQCHNPHARTRVSLALPMPDNGRISIYEAVSSLDSRTVPLAANKDFNSPRLVEIHADSTIPLRRRTDESVIPASPRPYHHRRLDYTWVPW